MRGLVAITGATGHLGQALVRQLVDEGRPVRAIGAEPLDIAFPDLDDLPVERVQADVRDDRQVSRAIAGADVVLHLAARVSIASDDALLGPINVGGVANVLDACRTHGVRRLVHVSSVGALVPGGTCGEVEERAPLLDPAANAYGASKARGEQLVRHAIADGLDAVIVYPTGILGPGDPGRNHLNRMLLDLWRRRLPARVGGGFDWVDVRDVTAGIVAAERWAPAGGRYVLAGNWATVEELTTRAAAVGGVRPPRVALPMGVARFAAAVAEPVQRAARRPLRFTRSTLDTLTSDDPYDPVRARRELGYSPRPLQETLEDTFDWFVAHGLLPAPDRARGLVPA